jgi:hypothetical protein
MKSKTISKLGGKQSHTQFYLECAKTENQCKQATIKKALYPEVPGLTKSDKPKSMAFN